MVHIGGIIHESLIDGLGVRTVIFISGCRHNCANCQNKDMFNFDYGKVFDEDMQDYVVNYVKNDKILSGLTISGGDPIYSQGELINFVKKFKEVNTDKDIWLYTGFEYEEVKDLKIMDYVDVLVDGRFMNNLLDASLKFKGSSNQRIIDVKKSKETGSVVLLNV